MAQPIGGLIYPKGRIEELFRIFETGQVAVVVDAEHVVPVGMIPPDNVMTPAPLVDCVVARG